MLPFSRRWLSGLIGTAFLFSSIGLLRAEITTPVIVHEWGTFTCLQDEGGKALGGINVDDEPVPDFVYGSGGLVIPQYSKSSRNLGLPPYGNNLSKGYVEGDPSVTMRLETPVLYFYPPKGQLASSVPPLDVHVAFHGGILSEYYPVAEAKGFPSFGTSLTEATTTELTWKGVHLGSSGKPVETEDRVWTTPREVAASLLEVGSQVEHFLFYRGVGHLESPFALLGARGQHVGTQQKPLTFLINRTIHDKTALPDSWLVEIKQDGSCAFRSCAPSTLTADSFHSGDFDPANLTNLKASMQAALVKEGLYPDEASAMLRTWELSYFKSPGLRFFYIAPRKWVDQVLPLTITGAPVDITRVMVGRIELVTNEQQAALFILAEGPPPNLAAVKQAAQNALNAGKLPKAEIDAFYRGEKPLTELGIPIPPLVRDYLSLGRFRDALIVHEQSTRPSKALEQFIRENSLVPQKQ